MMLFGNERIEAQEQAIHSLQDAVNKLQKKVEELEKKTEDFGLPLVVNPWSSMMDGIFMRLADRQKTSISLREAVSKLLDHCGLEVKRMESNVSIVKRKKK